MTFPQLIERVSSLPTGGYITVDSRLDAGLMASIINSARAYIVCERWKMYGKVPPIYYQTFYPEYIKTAQDEGSCYSKFYNLPPIIALDGRSTGLGYIGSSNTLNSFREVSSRQALSSMLNNRIIAIKRKPLALIGNGGELEIYFRDTVKLPQLEAVFADPRQVPLYNVDYDEYPMDSSDIPKMEDYLTRGAFQLVYKTPIDRVNDGRDITVPPAVRP
jgi:hypothetical protein